ncbi:MAG: YggT family protein [Sphingomicrobium sp.]
MVLAFIDIARLLLDILWWVIIIQIVISWLIAFKVINTGSGGVRAFLVALDRLTQPLYRPIRKLLPDFGGIDFSPMVILILIAVIKRLLSGAAAQYTLGG